MHSEGKSTVLHINHSVLKTNESLNQSVMLILYSPTHNPSNLYWVFSMTYGYNITSFRNEFHHFTNINIFMHWSNVFDKNIIQ